MHKGEYLTTIKGCKVPNKIIKLQSLHTKDINGKVTLSSKKVSLTLYRDAIIPTPGLMNFNNVIQEIFNKYNIPIPDGMSNPNVDTNYPVYQEDPTNQAIREQSNVKEKLQVTIDGVK